MKWVLLVLGLVFGLMFMVAGLGGMVLLFKGKTILQEGMAVQILRGAISAMLGSAICFAALFVGEQRSG